MLFTLYSICIGKFHGMCAVLYCRTSLFLLLFLILIQSSSVRSFNAEEQFGPTGKTRDRTEQSSAQQTEVKMVCIRP